MGRAPEPSAGWGTGVKFSLRRPCDPPPTHHFPPTANGLCWPAPRKRPQIWGWPRIKLRRKGVFYRGGKDSLFLRMRFTRSARFLASFNPPYFLIDGCFSLSLISIRVSRTDFDILVWGRSTGGLFRVFFSRGQNFPFYPLDTSAS